MTPDEPEPLSRVVDWMKQTGLLAMVTETDAYGNETKRLKVTQLGRNVHVFLGHMID